MALLSARSRKFLGTLFIVILMIFYALLTVTVASVTLADKSWPIHLAFFAISGILWILPAMAIIKWMSTDV